MNGHSWCGACFVGNKNSAKFEGSLCGFLCGAKTKLVSLIKRTLPVGKRQVSANGSSFLNGVILFLAQLSQLLRLRAATMARSVRPIQVICALGFLRLAPACHCGTGLPTANPTLPAVLGEASTQGLLPFQEHAGHGVLRAEFPGEVEKYVLQPLLVLGNGNTNLPSGLLVSKGCELEASRLV